MVFIEGFDGSAYGQFCFSPAYNDAFTQVMFVDLEWDDGPGAYGYQRLNKEDVGRLISYLQKQLEDM